jgi:hypothetical protein
MIAADRTRTTLRNGKPQAHARRTRASEETTDNYGSRIISLLKAALECSVYVSPRDPGLTYGELATIGTTAGYLEGEVNDALRHVGSRFYGVPRVVPAEQDIGQWAFFFPENPEYKDYAALDFVFDELNLRLRSEGEARA